MQDEPLIKKEKVGGLPRTQAAFVNFNEREEATCIASVTFMRQNIFKTYFLVPLLSILTIFILPLKMYWSSELCCDMLYDIVDDINKATHVKIVGRPGNTDICKLENLTDKVRPIL